MDEHTTPTSTTQDEETSPILPAAEEAATSDPLPEAGSPPIQQEPELASPAPEVPEEEPLPRSEDQAAPPQATAADDAGEQTHAPVHQPQRRLTRRQALITGGVATGLLAIGGGTTLAVLTSPPAPGALRAVPATATAAQTALPTQATSLPLDQTLQAWRTKHLTASPKQRFQHQHGTTPVPLGVVEPTFPNPYNPYHGHVQGYVLGGTLVATNQFFLYLGLASMDGSQFIGKFRVGPIDQPAEQFGLLVTQQSTDTIEGGAPDYPLVTLAPKAFYQAISALVNHCIVVDCIRQPLPAEAEDVPQAMRLDINQQARISDQFLQVDYEVIHHMPLGHISASKLAPIRHLVDTSAITYTTSDDGARYPLVTQVVLRHSDQIFPKLVSGE